MSLEVLWAGWRMAYVVDAASAPGETDSDECLFCRLPAGVDTEMLILERTELTFTVMNAYPYASGHLMVAPLRHEATIEGLSGLEGAAVFAAVQRAARAIRSVYEPHGMNVGANIGRAAGAGVPTHMHLHVLPRWSGDTNFMTSVASARVMPESLQQSYERLRGAWPTV